MRQRNLCLAALPLLLACSSKPVAQGERRAELKTMGPASVRVVPAAHQLPFCLLFTVSEQSVVRQLTMTPERRSVPCAAGEPIGGTTCLIPPQEGKVSLYVIFSDQAIGADSIAQQIHESAMSKRRFSAMDL